MTGFLQEKGIFKYIYKYVWEYMFFKIMERQLNKNSIFRYLLLKKLRIVQ